MPVEFPLRAKDIDTYWLESALADHLNGARVCAAKAERLSEPGQTSEAIDISVIYDDKSCPLPTRFIAKLGSNDPEVLRLIDRFGHYRREVSFYRAFPDLGLPKPKCFFASCSDDGLKMVLLLEHLAPARSPSWAPSLAEIEMALNHLPAFHAKWWNAPGLKQSDCLVSVNHQMFLDTFALAAAVADDVLTTVGAEAEEAVSCVVTVSQKIERWQDYLDAQDYTIVHTDYHGKQMFTPSAEGGKFAMIDWQYPYAAQGAWDFARLLGTCLPSAYWEQHGERLINSYHEGLIENGVADYSREDLLDAIRFGLIMSSAISCIATASTDTNLCAKECEGLGLNWKDVWFYRHAKMMRDLDVGSFAKRM